MDFEAIFQTARKHELHVITRVKLGSWQLKQFTHELDRARQLFFEINHMQNVA